MAQVQTDHGPVTLEIEDLEATTLGDLDPFLEGRVKVINGQEKRTPTRARRGTRTTEADESPQTTIPLNGEDEERPARPGRGVVWVEGHVNRDGVRHKGHWRKRPRNSAKAKAASKRKSRASKRTWANWTPERRAAQVEAMAEGRRRAAEARRAAAS
jgi:hypothetical protein